MDGLLNLLSLYTDQNVGGENNLGQFLETCRTHQSFSEQANENDVNHAVGIINSKLNNTDSRIEGVVLLDVLVTQCGTDIFTSNCVSWTQQVMRLLHGPSKTSVGHTSCVVLGKLLSFSAQFPEVSRQLSTTVISQLVTLLCDPEFTEKASIKIYVLECLKSCMEYYGSSCGPSKATIERHLLSLIDWDEMALDSSLRATWASCVAQLPSLGGSGLQGAQHKSNWMEFCLNIIDSIHYTINGMFRNIDEVKTQEASTNPLKLPELTHKKPMTLMHLFRLRFVNLCSALVSLLKEPFPTSKNIPIDRLLAMISRLLVLNSKSLSKTARANFAQLTLASIIPDLQAGVLDVLATLVVVCRSQLMTRATTVMNLFVQVLQWTFTPLDKRRVAAERPYGKLRIQVYRSLCLWLAASRSACGLTKCVDVLFSQILSDIIVHRDTVQLLTVNQPTSGVQTSRKGKKKLIDNPGVILHKDDLKANADVCQAALQCLSTILLCCGPRIKPTIHKEIQEITLSILIEIMNGAELKTLLPYNDPRCRTGLYRVLEKLVLCASPQWPAPLNYASAVFNSGMNDPNLEVATVCVESLVSIQSILRPRGPTLNFALEAKQLRIIQKETPLLNGQTFNKPTESIPIPMVSQPMSADIPMEQPTLPTQEVRDSSPPRMVEIRQPESSPKPSKRLSDSNSSHDEFSTPPNGVTTIENESPTNRTTRMMTRKEALKVIAAASLPPQQAKTEPLPSPPEPTLQEDKTPTARKRPHQDSEPLLPSQEKVLKELPYGTDEIDDNLEAMLASFRDVPAE